MSNLAESTENSTDCCAICNAQLGPYEFELWEGSDGSEIRVPLYKIPYVLVQLGDDEDFVCEGCYEREFYTRYSIEEKFQLHFEFGLEYANFGNFQKSIECLGRASDIQRTAEVLIALARAYGSSGDSSQEVNYLRQAVDLNPTHLVAVHNLIVCLVRYEQFYEALALIDESFGELGHDDQLLMWLAEIYYRRREIDTAREFYERAKEIAHCEDCAAEYEQWWNSLKAL